MERDRVNFCLWFMWAWRVCVWDVNRGEVHWASELVQSGFWHARAVHTNFIGSRWHDSPYGLAATACSLWTYPQILLSVCPVMLHALTRINSAVLIPLKSRQKSNVRPVRTSQPFFVSASSVFSLTGSLLRCWLCDISEGGFLLCLIHLSVLPSVWQGLNYCGEHKGPHPTWFICTDLRSPAECKENISSVSSKTFHHPRSSYIVRWYFHSIVQMYYAGI